MAHGSPTIFLTRPIALVLMAAGLTLTAWTLVISTAGGQPAWGGIVLVACPRARALGSVARSRSPRIRPGRSRSSWRTTRAARADVAARLVAAHASKKWGQPVNVVNMPGASGITGALRALNARPDGYTLLLDPHATSAMLFAVESDVPFKMDGKTQIALDHARSRDLHGQARLAVEDAEGRRGGGEGEPEDVPLRHRGRRRASRASRSRSSSSAPGCRRTRPTRSCSPAARPR